MAGVVLSAAAIGVLSAPSPVAASGLGVLSWLSTSEQGPLGGATFEVFARATGFDLTVTDDDARDADPTPGRLALGGLPVYVSYTVCELIAPPGFESRSGCQVASLSGSSGGGFTFENQTVSVSTFTVTTPADDQLGTACLDPCTLREAIGAANGSQGSHDRIVFAIPNGQSKDIVPTSELPSISDPVTIDGLSEPGIRIVGGQAGAGANGLHIVPSGSGSVIRGLEISGFQGSGIWLEHTQDVVVGGQAPREANRLADNTNDGITLVGDVTSSGNQFLGSSLVGNGDAPIDLGNDGGQHGVGGHVGDASGPNHLQNPPILGAPTDYPLTTLPITASARASYTARVEVFWSSTCALYTTYAGQAEQLVGTLDVPTATGLGPPPPPTQMLFATPLTSGYLTATATTPDGTSELSTCTAVTAASDFVGRIGTQLIVGSEAYRPIGLDIYNANSNGWCWYRMDDPVPDGSPIPHTVLDDSLAAIGSGKNVIRAWFFQPLATTNGVRDWTAFDRTLASARTHGYKVIATLIDQWGDCGASTVPGYGYKDPNWYSTGYTQPDPAGTVSYRAWAQEVAARYQTDPTVLAWQLVNEPEVGHCDTAVPEPAATKLLHDFAKDVSGAIKAVDPNHLVSLGTIGSGQCGAQGTDFGTVMDVASVDLCEFHDDVSPNQLVPGDQWNGLRNRIDQCNALGKPLLVGELGVRPSDVAGTLADRAKVVSDKVCAQLTSGAAGVLLWAWDKNGSLLDNYDIGPSDPVLDVLSPWSDPDHTCAVSSEPSAPRQVVAAAGPGTASVSWVAPASDGGSPIVSYTVTTDPVGPGGPIVIPGATTTAQINLVNDVTYAVMVTATNATGAGAISNASDSVTPRVSALAPTTVAEDLPPGGTVTTPGGSPTPGAPVLAAVQVPAGGPVTIAVATGTTSPPAGFSFLGQQVVISAPNATIGAPLTLTFTLEGTLVTVPLTEIKVVRTEGGVQQPPLGNCSGTATATPNDPCVVTPPTRDPVTGDVTITVLTSSASTWNLAIDSTPPLVTIDGVSRPYVGATGASTLTWHANENGTYSVRLGGVDCSTGTVLASGTYATTPSPVDALMQATSLAIGSNQIRVCVTDAALNTGSTIATIVKDTTAPTVTSIALAGPSPTSALSVAWTVTFSEPVTGVAAANFTLIRVGVGGSPAITGVTGGGATWTVTASSGTGDWALEANLASRAGIVDLAGNPLANTLLGKIYQIDRVAPSVTITRPAAGAAYTLGATVNANFACADELVGSGIAMCTGTTVNGAPIDTTSIGPKTFTVIARDRAGNSAPKVASYSVIYPFNGFLGSVANPPTVNPIKAGISVPVSFSLGGNRGLAILAAGSPSVRAVDCTTHVPTGVSAPSTGALAYNSGTGRYSYTWQTNAAWAGTCQQLSLVLNDGTSHLAYFRLTK